MPRLCPLPQLWVMKRLAFVDALRGLAVAGMLVIHQSEWWLTPAARRTATFATLYFLSKLVAPIFLTLVGAVLVLRFGGRPSRWIDLKPVLLRGLKILALGYIFNLAVWAPVWGLEEFASWDVLQLIGFSMGTCGLLLLAPWWARLALVLGMVWLSTTLPPRQQNSPIPSWPNWPLPAGRSCCYLQDCKRSMPRENRRGWGRCWRWGGSRCSSTSCTIW